LHTYTRMPGRKKYLKSKGRRPKYSKKGTRKTYKKKGSRPGDMMLYRGIGIADQFFTKLKFVENITLAGSVGVPYKTYQWNANNLYDLRAAIGGGQAMYYDQICGPTALYQRYLVTGSKVKLRLSSNSDSVSSGNIDCCVTPSQTTYSSVLWANVDDQIAMKDTRSKSVVRYDNGGVKYLQHYASSKKMLDYKDMRDNLEEAGAYSTGPPNNQWYWILGAQGMDRNSVSWTMTVRCELTCYVMFYTPNNPTQS